MTQKDALLEKLIKHPLDFGDLDFKHLTDPATGLQFDDLRMALKRVYNINESALRTESDATTGVLGQFNRYMTARRQKAYFRKINAGFVGTDGHKVIVAEGDSWFQFFGRDIINWLDDHHDYAIYSMSYAGDWLANILFEEKNARDQDWFDELHLKPRAFKQVSDTYRRCLDSHFSHLKATQDQGIIKNPTFHFWVKGSRMS